MRDPKRIPKILDELKGIWSMVPDLRLGQLILNVLQDPILYYLEDEEVIKRLREHYSGVHFETNKSNIQDKG
jgi:hypothetical protein